MVVCPKCGNRNSDESVFCTNCQHKLFRRAGGYTTTEARQSPFRLVNDSGIEDTQPAAKYRLHNKQAPEEKVAEPAASSRQETPPPFEREPYKTDPGKPPKTKIKVHPIRKIINILLMITIPAMLYLAYFIIGMADDAAPVADSKASSIFVQAENFYQQQSYLAAQNLYVQFAAEFPEDPLSEIVLRRIEEINGGLLSIEEEQIYRRQRIRMLMEIAEKLYLNNKTFESPENDILGKLSEVKSLDSANAHASDMLTKSIDKYKKNAEGFFKAGQYTKAKTIYEYLLATNPKDKNLSRRISRIDAAMKEADKKTPAAENLPDKPAMAGLTKGSDKSASRNQNSRDSGRNSLQATAAVSQREDVKNSSVADSQTADLQRDSLVKPLSQLNSNSAASTQREEIPASVASRDAKPVQPEQKTNTATNLLASTAPVLESFLDAGQRELIKKVDPDYPRAYLKIKKEGTVIIEAVIGKDGRVVSHRVLQSDGELFTEVCVRALKKYRYKTGTVNNIPVLYKITELFKFKID